jgi:hypothetical protein
MLSRRSRTSVHLVTLAACLALPVSLMAQFQPPTDEELKMTAEPKAPGAAAIYLYREETVDDNLHYHSLYARIKVLTEKGEELATVSVPYAKGSDSITDVKARTIHSDGTITLLDVKPADLVAVKGKEYQINKMVFTLPSAEVGSILEYRWQLRYSDETLNSPDWEIQQPYYVRKAHYLFNPYKYLERVTDSKGNGASRLSYTTMLPPGVKVNFEQNINKYSLDITDVAAIPDEEYMPPMGAFEDRVKFYYTSSFNKDDYWKHEGATWSRDMDKFGNESKGLKEVVAGLIASADSEDVKAHKLYDAVMTLDNTDYTRRKSSAEMKQLGIKQVKTAEDVWKQKSGSSDEIALVYMAMARIAGLKANAAVVSNRDRQFFNQFFMSMRQLDDVLVIVSINGKETVLDPGTRYASFGELDWRHMFVSGLRQMDKVATFFTTNGNTFKEDVTSRIADLTLQKDGTISGTVRISMTGPAALRWRHMAIENDEDEVKKRFDEHMRGLVPDGVTADFDHFIGLTDFHSQLMAVVKISGNLGTVTGKRAFLPGVFFESHAKHPFVAEESRQAPIDMAYPDSVRDEVTYHIPAEFAVESAPTDTSVPWPNHAVFVLKAAAKNKEVQVVRTLAKNFALLDPKEYKDLRDFYQKIATADQQQLVLTLAAPQSGN